MKQQRRASNLDTSLGMTLVSGLATSGRELVTALMCGNPTGLEAEADFGDDTTDALELGVDLAEDLIRQADGGRRGNIIVDLSPDVDVQRVGLAMEHILRDAGALGTPGDASDPRGDSLDPSTPLDPTTADLDPTRGRDYTAGPREFVTVANVSDIRRLLFQEGDGDAGLADAAGDTGDELAARLAAQLEFASVVVLTGTDAHQRQAVSETCSLIQHLNPTAVITTPAVAGDLGRRLRHLQPRLAGTLASTQGWMLRLDERIAFPPSRGSIDSVVFRDPRPFHPERLEHAVTERFSAENVGLILRSRGLFRLASRPERVGDWSSAGSTVELGATTLRSWDEDAPVGQQLVFFGRGLRKRVLGEILADCVLRDDELLAGAETWAAMRDPFPVWE